MTDSIDLIPPVTVAPEEREERLWSNDGALVALLRDWRMTWVEMLSEWIDNALDANARRIIIRKTKRKLQIIDNGLGCENLRKMESIGEHVKTLYTRSGHYGIGGVLSQISASGAGCITVETVTAKQLATIRVDWNKCLETGQLTCKTNEMERPRGRPTGTTLTIERIVRNWSDIDKIKEEIRWRYSAALASGCKISFEIDGETENLKPYRHPPFVADVPMIEFRRDCEGYPITGFCGLVRPGIANPYPGWSIRFAHRLMGRFTDPAGCHAVGRIYAEVNLPDDWPNRTPTKDGFIHRPDALWEMLAECCAPIIAVADKEAQQIQLTSATKAAQEILADVLSGGTGLKGRRPGKAGKEGTVSTNGNGSPHEHFTTSQPGDKPSAESRGSRDRSKIPDAIDIEWMSEGDDVVRVDVSTFRGRRLRVTLNDSYELIGRIKDHAPSLAVVCLFAAAAEGFVSPDKFQQMFEWFKEGNFRANLRELFLRVKPSQVEA